MPRGGIFSAAGPKPGKKVQNRNMSMLPLAAIMCGIFTV
jgi:hypothetical protein